MTIPDGTPRRGVEPDPLARIMSTIRTLRTDVDGLQRGSTLRNASVSGGDGLRVLDDNGDTVVTLTAADGGGVIASTPEGVEMARFGKLIHTSPGEYGVEVNGGDSWVRLGYQSTTWEQIAGKPTTFTPSGHNHPGSAITSAVANATNAGFASKAAQADGSEYAFSNNVTGTEFYAVWVGNDGGFHLGRNTSSIRYKENVRDATVGDHAALDLRPVIYDRRPSYRYPVDDEGNRLEGPAEQIAGARNEFGLIAEEVAAVLPELVTTYQGDIDGVRYDLLGVALLPVVKSQAAQLAAHEERIAALERAIEGMTT